MKWLLPVHFGLHLPPFFIGKVRHVERFSCDSSKLDSQFSVDVEEMKFLNLNAISFCFVHEMKKIEENCFFLFSKFNSPQKLSFF